MKSVLAIDQSTQGTKGILLNDRAEIVAKAYLPHRQIITPKGYISHDPNEIYKNVLGVAAKLLSECPSAEIAAVGISNQRETTAAWDGATNEPVTDAIVWHCSRAGKICDSLTQDERKLILSSTGLPASPFFPAAKAAWILEHVPRARELADKDRLKFGTVDSWLIYRLCGEHLCDVSNASRTQLMNLSSLRWDENILKIFGITPEMLPKILPSDGNFGMTDFCGLLKHKAPILAVMGDSHSALFAHRCENPGQLKITYGTGSSVMMNTGSRIIRSENGLASSVAWGFGGKIFYVLEGNINYSGEVVTWLKDSLKLINSPAETEALAEDANISDRTCLVPAFSGLGAPYWSENSRAAIIGMSRLTGKAEIVRAALSSICLQINDVLEAMKRDSGLDMGIAYADGGPTENRYLMQLQSDLSQIEIKVSEENELSALGVGFMAGIRAGLFSDDAAFGKRGYRSFTPKMSDGERKTCLSDWKRAVEAVTKGSI